MTGRLKPQNLHLADLNSNLVQDNNNKSNIPNMEGMKDLDDEKNKLPTEFGFLKLKKDFDNSLSEKERCDCMMKVYTII